MDLSLAVITKSVLWDLIRIDLGWEVGISNGLTMELFVFAQLFEFGVPAFKLIGLIRAWICPIVVHGHLSRIIIIIISVNFLVSLFIKEDLALFAGFRRLSPRFLHTNIWTSDTGTKDRLDSRGEISTRSWWFAVLSLLRPVDFIDILYDIQVLHHVVDSLVFGFTLGSPNINLLPFWFELCVRKVKILFLGVFERVTVVATLRMIKHVVVIQVHSRLDIYRSAIPTNQVLLGARILIQNVWGHGVALTRQLLNTNKPIIKIIDRVRRLSDIILMVEGSANQLFLTLSALEVFRSIRLEHDDLVVGLSQSIYLLSIVNLIGFFLSAQGAWTGRKRPILLWIVYSFHRASNSPKASNSWSMRLLNLHAKESRVALGTFDVVGLQIKSGRHHPRTWVLVQLGRCCATKAHRGVFILKLRLW